MRHILYFTADWCNPCKRTKPFAEELIAEGAKIQFIDADSQLDMIKNFNVSTVPTFILIEDGKEINRMTGGKTKDQLEQFLNG
jgi:thioredoxin 1